CLSEASLRAVPHRREKRRGPVGAAGRFATGPAFFLVTSSLQEQRRSDSPKRRSRWRKLLLLPPQEAAFAVPPLIAVRAFQSKATSKAVSTSASRLPSHFSLLVQRKVTKRKHSPNRSPARLRRSVTCASRTGGGRPANSLRSDMRASTPPPALRCSARYNGRGRATAKATANTTANARAIAKAAADANAQTK